MIVPPPAGDALAPAALPRQECGLADRACRGLQLLAPQPGAPLEADRPEHFSVAVPGAAAVAVGCEEVGWVQLQPADAQGAAAMLPAAGASSSGCGSSSSRASSAGQVQAEQQQQEEDIFSGSIVLPRASRCCIAARFPGASAWLQLISIPVLPPAQQLVQVVASQEAPTLDTAEPAVARAAKLLAALDSDADGRVSRRDMLLAFRRDRQLADHLRMPARIRVRAACVDPARCVHAYAWCLQAHMHACAAHSSWCACPRALQMADGSFGSFSELFLSINSDGLGFIDLHQLHAHLAAVSHAAAASRPPPSRGAAAAPRAGAAHESSAAASCGSSRSKSVPSSAATRLVL